MEDYKCAVADCVSSIAGRRRSAMNRSNKELQMNDDDGPSAPELKRVQSYEKDGSIQPQTNPAADAFVNASASVPF